VIKGLFSFQADLTVGTMPHPQENNPWDSPWFPLTRDVEQVVSPHSRGSLTRLE
jgi:hypothetical protein